MPFGFKYFLVQNITRKSKIALSTKIIGVERTEICFVLSSTGGANLLLSKTIQRLVVLISDQKKVHIVASLHSSGQNIDSLYCVAPYPRDQCMGVPLSKVKLKK